MAQVESKFSKRSLERLQTCDPELQELFMRVIQVYDCTILEGHRDEATQTEYYNAKKSKVQYPDSKHNIYPSLAVDVAPHPIDWGNTKRFTYFAGIVIGIASQMGIRIRWGGNWDMDGVIMDDQTFQDLVHFEVMK